MAIAFVSQGTTPSGTTANITGTTSVTPALPASLATGHLVLIAVVNKLETATPTTPTNWTLVGSIAGGFGAAAADDGQLRTTVFSRIKDTGWSTMPAITITGGNSAMAQAFAFSNATGAWDVVAASGVDSTSGAQFLADTTTDPGLTTGDWGFAVAGVTTDSPTWVTATFTTTGITWGTVTERSEPKTTQGNDLGGFVATAAVSSGTSSGTTNISSNGTVGTLNATGTLMFVRLRETTSTTPISGSESNSLAVSESTAITVTLPASESNSLATSETSAIAVTQPGSESNSLAVSESTAINVTRTATESNSLAVSETSAVTVVLSAAESNSLAVADSSGVVASVAVIGSESNSLAIAETSAPQVSQPVSESNSLAVSETAAISVTVAGSESNSLAVSETASILVIQSASDTAAVSISVEGKTIAFPPVNNLYSNPSFEGGAPDLLHQNAGSVVVNDGTAYSGRQYIRTTMFPTGLAYVLTDFVPTTQSTVMRWHIRIREVSGTKPSDFSVWLRQVRSGQAPLDSFIAVTPTGTWSTVTFTTTTGPLTEGFRVGFVGTPSDNYIVEIDAQQANLGNSVQAYDEVTQSVTASAAESNSIAVADSSTALAASQTATESNSLSVSETSSVEVFVAASESNSLAVSDTASVTVTVSASESNSLAVSSTTDIGVNIPVFESAVAVSGKTSETTWATNANLSVAAGKTIIFGAGFDNLSTTTPTITGIDVPSGETAVWERIALADSPTSTGGSGLRSEVWRITTTVAWNTFNPSVTFSAAITAKSGSFMVFSGIGSTVVRGTYASNSVVAGSGTASAILTGASSPLTNDVVIALFTNEDNGVPGADTDTTNGDWVSPTGSTGNTTGGLTPSNQGHRMSYKIVTANGDQTANASSIESDNGVTVVALGAMQATEKSGSESNSISVDETTSTVATGIAEESNSLAVSETSDISVIISAAESNSLAVSSESSEISPTTEASETNSLAISSTVDILVFVEANDSATISVAEATATTRPIEASETNDLTVTESSVVEDMGVPTTPVVEQAIAVTHRVTESPWVPDANLTVEVGKTIIFGVGFDNLSTTSPTITGITVPAEETAVWERVGLADSSNAFSNAGLRSEVWRIKTTVAWNNFDPSIAFSSAIQAKSGSFFVVNGLTGDVRGSYISASHNNTPQTVTLTGASTPLKDDLVIALFTNENNTIPGPDTDTIDGAWVTPAGGTANTTGGTAQSNIGHRMSYKTVTASGPQSANASTASNDNGVIAIAFISEFVESRVVSDSSAISVAESRSVDVGASVGDTNSLSVTETATIFRAVTSSDSISLSVTETSIVANPVSASESISISVADSASVASFGEAVGVVYGAGGITPVQVKGPDGVWRDLHSMSNPT